MLMDASSCLLFKYLRWLMLIYGADMQSAGICNSALSSGLSCSVKCIDRAVLSFPYLSIVFPALVGDCSESYRSYWLSRKCIDLKTEVIEGSIVNCDGCLTISLFPFP